MSYEAASSGARTMHWHATSQSANSVLLRSLPNLRNRSREQYRNNPWVANAIDRIVSNEVGVGIQPLASSGDTAFNDQAKRLFAQWSQESDADGVLSFYGLQAQISRARNLSGECFIRLRHRRLSDGLSVPLQIQVLESDLIPLDKNGILANDHTIRAGIEFNRKGKRVAYHIYKQHPSEGLTDTVRVPAKMVIHHFNPLRPGQVRGEPVSAQSLLKAKTFDQYDDAELKRKETRSTMTGFIKRDMPDDFEGSYDPITGEQLPDKSAIDQSEFKIQSGSFVVGLPGEEPILFDGDNTGGGYADFMRQQLLGIAAGYGVPYELITGDWSKVNDRLVRAILNEFRRTIQANQEHLLINQVCQPIWRSWIKQAVLSGALEALYSEDLVKCDWRTHAWPYVNPAQDIDAKIKSIEAGLTSRDAVIAESGKHGADVDAQRMEETQRWEELTNA